MNKILIPTIAEDSHAYAVAAALRLKGAEPIIWYTTDFPTQALETVDFDNGVLGIEIRDNEKRLLLTDVHCLWNRRPHEELGPARLDPADKGFAHLQCSRFRNALLNILSDRARAQGVFCVNPWESALRCENKLWQHYRAEQAGLEMPESLYTNDPSRIRDFMSRHEGLIAYKPFLGGVWNDGTTDWGSFTSAISPDMLVEDDLLQAVPGIYQELIPKAYELRVTMIGERAFTARLNSQQTENGQLDWRRAYDDLKMERWVISEDLRRRCVDLMRRLGIVFGCMDFVVTPEGRHVFLEVNQAGQFLFVEEYCGLPLLDAFSELLLQARVDFEWKESSSAVRFADVKQASSDALATEVIRHVESRSPASREGAARGELAGTAADPEHQSA